MLDRERPDLVAVCLPNEGHFEPTLRIIKAGFPLLVEKPLVFDLHEADELLAEAERRDLFFAINFNHRYAKPVQLAHEAMRNGALGRLTFATWRFGGEAGTSSHPHANLIETQCHGLDMLEHLCGPISSVMAQMSDATGTRLLDAERGAAVRQRRRGVAPGLVRLVVQLSRHAPARAERSRRQGAWSRTPCAATRSRPPATRSATCGRPGTSTTASGTSTPPSTGTSTRCCPPSSPEKQPPVHATAGRRALHLGHCIIESFETGTRIGTL